MQNVCSQVFPALVHQFIGWGTRMVYKHKGFLTQRAVHPSEPWAASVSRGMLWESVKGFAEIQVDTSTDFSSSTGGITLSWKEIRSVSQDLPFTNPRGQIWYPAHPLCAVWWHSRWTALRMNWFPTQWACTQLSAICITFCSFVYSEMLYLAVSWVSYSPPERTRGVLHRTSLVLWWIAIIPLISLVPAAHQLNCWVLLI